MLCLNNINNNYGKKNEKNSCGNAPVCIAVIYPLKSAQGQRNNIDYLLQEAIVVNEINGWKATGEECDHFSAIAVVATNLEDPQARDVPEVGVNDLLDTQLLKGEKGDDAKYFGFSGVSLIITSL